MDLTNFKSGTGTGIIVKHTNRQLFELYIKDIAKHKPLSREEEQALFVLIKETKDPAAIEKIWKHNLLFVVSVARRYAASLKSSVITMEDLVTEGNIGVYDAIERFDHTQGYKFISYAVWHIRRRILDCINRNIKSIKLPSSIRSELNNLNKKREQLEQEHGRPVNILEVFEEMLECGDITEIEDISRLEEMLKLNQFEQSLNTKVGEEEHMEIGDLIANESPSPMDMVLKNERKQLVYSILNDVPSEVRNYIKDYFGLETNIPLNYGEIANKYGKKQHYIASTVDKYISWLRRKKMGSKNFFFPESKEETLRKAELDSIVINELAKTTYKKGLQPSTDYLIY
jgi:RNA polymerase primary sigma factor